MNLCVLRDFERLIDPLYFPPCQGSGFRGVFGRSVQLPFIGTTDQTAGLVRASG